MGSEGDEWMSGRVGVECRPIAETDLLPLPVVKEPVSPC